MSFSMVENRSSVIPHLVRISSRLHSSPKQSGSVANSRNAKCEDSTEPGILLRHKKSDMIDV